MSSFYFHTVKWFQVLLYNGHNFISVICLHTVCSIWPIDRCYHSRSEWTWGAMARMGYSTLPKSPWLEPHHQIVYQCRIQDTGWGGVFYPSAAMQLVYSTALPAWAMDSEKESTKSVLSAQIDNDDSVTIFTNPSTQAGYDTRSIFKWSLTGLNSEFSFS